MKIGLVQTQSLGDLIIALPIAAWYADRGCEVIWPINESYLDVFVAAAPYARFLAVSSAPGQRIEDVLYNRPMEMLRRAGCERIFMLDRNYAGNDAGHTQLALGLKFDEFKYAVAGVPFAEKWNLRLERDPGRERLLHNALNLTRPHVCVHLTGSDTRHQLQLPEHWRERYDLIDVQPLTGNPFDWLHTLETASKRVMLDSCFSNLCDQLGHAGDNYLILRSPAVLTPVLQGGWIFLHPDVKGTTGTLQPLGGGDWNP